MVYQFGLIGRLNISEHYRELEQGVDRVTGFTPIFVVLERAVKVGKVFGAHRQVILYFGKRYEGISDSAILDSGSQLGSKSLVDL
jgi:hypothetical protein